MTFFWNRMTPRVRRTFVKATVFTAAVFGTMAAMGWWSWPAVFGTIVLNGLVVAFWPSNKALKEAERLKELGDGDG